MNECVIILPAYNEEENVRKLTNTWFQYEKKIEEQYHLSLKVVVVNDGSHDKTEEICKQIEKEYDNFVLVNHPKNKGLGEAVKTGIIYALKQCPNCKYVGLMDCDNTHNPKFILSMLERILHPADNNKCDVVIASRYQQGSKVVGVAKHRLLTSEGARWVYSALLHVKNVKDYTCGYRLYSRNILEKCYHRFQNSIVEESGFTCMAELLYKLYSVGAKFAEVPFVLRYDLKEGASKMKVIKTACNSIALAFKLRRIPRYEEK